MHETSRWGIIEKMQKELHMPCCVATQWFVSYKVCSLWVNISIAEIIFHDEFTIFCGLLMFFIKFVLSFQNGKVAEIVRTAK